MIKNTLIGFFYSFILFILFVPWTDPVYFLYLTLLFSFLIHSAHLTWLLPETNLDIWFTIFLYVIPFLIFNTIILLKTKDESKKRGVILGYILVLIILYLVHQSVIALDTGLSGWPIKF